MKTSWCMLLFALTTGAGAAEVKVAVASNFVAPLKQLAAEFEKSGGHQLQISSGATGKLFAQISNGAPFEVFLAADDEAPQRLIANGLAVKDTAFTYASGRLVLWRADGNTPNQTTLKTTPFKRLAIANPKVAPYGRAALEYLQSQGLSSVTEGRLVYGENIAQTLQFASSGNADLALVAASLVTMNGQITQGRGWLVPAQYHQPIKQDAVLLKKGQDNAAARAFLQYLQSGAAQKIIRQYGYQ
ncbi:molybdate ABC transporter substrate-binding protein [Chitinibacter sp. SCUT-21]|uniref:molybdate ABC transporter substrate-binding protein n=1 Tax=Chitinibacter sp. SCUT-21 TaxID=2970891 RepID=UPI0035A5D2D4